jgi:hypothetical protein
VIINHSGSYTLNIYNLTTLFLKQNYSTLASNYFSCISIHSLLTIRVEPPTCKVISLLLVRRRVLRNRRTSHLRLPWPSRWYSLVTYHSCRARVIFSYKVCVPMLRTPVNPWDAFIKSLDLLSSRNLLEQLRTMTSKRLGHSYDRCSQLLGFISPAAGERNAVTPKAPVPHWNVR